MGNCYFIGVFHTCYAQNQENNFTNHTSLRKILQTGSCSINKCSNNLCCSKYEFCGSTSDYCGTGCKGGPCSSGSSDSSGSSVSSNILGCWKKAGTIPNICPANYYLSGLGAAGACISPCPSGSSYPDIVLTNMCKKNCPNGWASSSIDCFKPSVYGRGAGYGWRFWDPSWAWNTCTRENSQGCEGWGILYPKCSNGFHPVGCCICSPDCPADTSDKGALCGRNILSYTTRNPVQCDNNQYINAGLCYPTCPSDFPEQCGALCVVSGKCAQVTAGLSSSLLSTSFAVIKTGVCAAVPGEVLTPACIANLVNVLGLSTDSGVYIATQVPKFC